MRGRWGERDSRYEVMWISGYNHPERMKEYSLRF
jgi:hypothetical protein